MKWGVKNKKNEKKKKKDEASRVRDCSIFSHENACRINFNAARRFAKKATLQYTPHFKFTSSLYPRRTNY